MERETLAHLTAAQRAAVTHDSGPLLVLAGAGTGKTRVLVERIAWLVRERHVPPHRILALTFTEKAAHELVERVDLALPISAFQPWVGTFHGFGEFVLREEALAIGLDPQFRILSPLEAWLLLKRHLFSLPLDLFRPLGNPTGFLQALLDFFAQAKDQGVTPERLKEYACGLKSPEWQELAAVYSAYVQIQRNERLMDFGDLTLETVRLLRDRPNVRAAYRARFPEILVDEFQDTNRMQLELLELLSGPIPLRSGSAGQAGNLVVASDDDQAIFSFRGSNLANVLDFRARFKSSELIVLTDNFRSPQTLIDHAHRLIEQNNPYRLEATAGISKHLVSRKETDDRKPEAVVKHRHFSTEEEEFTWVASEILRLVDAGAAYRDSAVLTRTNAQAADFASFLTHRDIPHLITEARGLLARPEAKDILAYLRLLTDPRDGRSLFRLLTHPAFKVTPADRALVLAELKVSPTALALLESAKLQEYLTESSREGVKRLAQLLSHHLTAYRTTSPSDLILQFLERSGILKQAIAESASHPEVLPNLQALLSTVRSFERGAGNPDLLSLLDILSAATEGSEGPRSAELPADTDAVRVLTVHAAKGLEFPFVFVIGATADRYPSRNRRRTLELPLELVPSGGGLEKLDAREAHVLEERRLLYVALTRAERCLTLTSSTAAAHSQTRRKPSPFIHEAGISSVSVATDKRTPEEQLVLPMAASAAPRPPAEGLLRLSASKITDYDTCPLKYRFRYVLNVPTPPHYALSFGITIHRVLYDLARAVEAGQHPTIEDALGFYDTRWVSEGYESIEHERARQHSGRKALRQYLEIHPALRTEKPLAVEVPFSFFIGSTRVTGRIDRLDQADGSKNAVVVTDFKTGEGKSKSADTDVQLSIYAFATRAALGYEPARLQLSYVETGKDDVTSRTTEQDAETARHVEEVATRVRAEDFRATPGFHCRFCDFRTICDYAA